MRPPVVVTVLTAVLAIGAGVAIAGLPKNVPGADLVVLDVPSSPPTSPSSLPPATVLPVTPSTSAPTTDITIAEPEEQTPAPTSTLESSSITTTAPSSTQLDNGSTNDELRDRNSVVVAAANATARSGVAGTTSEALAAMGYGNVTAVDADTVADRSVVYHQPGFELEAARLAADLGWGELALGPMSEMPLLRTERQFELVAVIGRDVP